jgi:hypothetical protein
MGCSEGSDAPASRNPHPVPFSLTLPRQTYDGAVAVRPYESGAELVALDLELSGVHVGSAALTTEGAIDLCLRLIGAVVRLKGYGS